MVIPPDRGGDVHTPVPPTDAQGLGWGLEREMNPLDAVMWRAEADPMATEHGDRLSVRDVNEFLRDVAGCEASDSFMTRRSLATGVRPPVASAASGSG
jgi:hypothetical protein